MKLVQLEKIISSFEKKWKMNFIEFKKGLKNNSLGKDIYSFEIEKDFWSWEEAFTLKTHYETVQKEWIKRNI
ncbi:hypothetical protein MHK_001645 [Candidatus Magnetomorum sp. HK-1]|nr:hypothetical protein MHK_001645 [Candidatus Magnetomorum sp. HK-1]